MVPPESPPEVIAPPAIGLLLSLSILLLELLLLLSLDIIPPVGPERPLVLVGAGPVTPPSLVPVIAVVPPLDHIVYMPDIHMST